MLFPSLLLFFETFTHAKNSSKKFKIGNFFSLSSNFIYLFSPSVSFSVKLSTSLVLFVMKLYEKCFASLLSPCAKKFRFTHCQDYFISFQFLISFKLITPIVWYTFLFMRLYVASINPPTVTNIFSVSFFIMLKKSNPSRLNLTDFFYIFQTYFVSCHFLSLFLWGLFLHCLQSFVGLVSW